MNMCEEEYSAIRDSVLRYYREAKEDKYLKDKDAFRSIWLGVTCDWCENVDEWKVRAVLNDLVVLGWVEFTKQTDSYRRIWSLP